MPGIKTLLGPMRVPFLVLTPACVLLGLGTAVWTTVPLEQLDPVVILRVALRPARP